MVSLKTEQAAGEDNEKMAGLVDNALGFELRDYRDSRTAVVHLRGQEREKLSDRTVIAAENVLSLLASYHILATFFVSGQNARRYPELIKRIAEAGHEIASAGMDDTPMIRQSAEDFQKQLRQSKIMLEDLTSQQIVGFRAPHFTIIRETLWALDIIARLGFEYDSSIFPIRHEYFGIPDAPRHMHELKGLEGASLVELPPLTAMLAGQRLPVGGSPYLRFTPAAVVRMLINHQNRQGRAALLNFETWEFDPAGSRLEVPRPGRWAQNYNLGRTNVKLVALVERVRFCPLKRVVASFQVDSQDKNP